MPFANVGRHRLHYQCDGAGSPAVVFEAGIAASSLSWTRVQPEVARVTRACSYDRAGLAWSDLAGTRRTLPAIVGELRLLLQRAGIPPPYVLVGHSFGGFVIRAFARAYLSEVGGLVFVDPLHPAEWCPLTRHQQRLLRGGVFLSAVGAGLARLGVVRFCLTRLSQGSTAVPRRVSRLFGPTAAAVLERIVGEVQKLPPAVWPDVQEHWSQPRAFRGMRQHLAALPECAAEIAAHADDFADLPVVVISAGCRASQWLAADAALAGASTNGRHLISAKSGHWVQLDDPEIVVRAIGEVVGQLRGRESRSGGR